MLISLPQVRSELKSHPTETNYHTLYSAVCSLVRLEQSLAANTSYTASWRYCCLLGILLLFYMPFESNNFFSSTKVYAEFQLSNHPTLTPLITAYAQGTNVHTSLGPHFQRPGRTILERHLIDVPDPSSILKVDGLEELHRAFFCGEPCHLFSFFQMFHIAIRRQSSILHPIQRIDTMRKEMTWRDLLAYFRTWSALLTVSHLT